MKNISKKRWIFGGSIIFGIPLISIIISIIFALIKQISVIKVFGGLLFWFGLLYLFLHLLYYNNFNSNQKKIDNVLNHPPINKCPACKSNLETEEIRILNRIGIPVSDINLECPECKTRFFSKFPYGFWKVEEANEKANPEFTWLYSAESLSIQDMQKIGSGKFTDKAIQKIRAKELSRISDGYIEAILNLNKDGLIHPSLKENFLIFPTVEMLPSSFSPQKDEKFIIIGKNIIYEEERTKNNIPYFFQVEKGFFLITNKRWSFNGYGKNIVKKLQDICDIKHSNGRVILELQGRKRLIAFNNLDDALFASVLEGVTRVI